MSKPIVQTGVFDPAPLARALKRRGVSASEFARQIKTDHRTVYAALCGESVNLLKLARICKALEVTGIRFLE